MTFVTAVIALVAGVTTSVAGLFSAATFASLSNYINEDTGTHLMEVLEKHED